MNIDPHAAMRAKMARQELLRGGGKVSRWARFKRWITRGRSRSTYHRILDHLHNAQSATNDRDHKRSVATALRLSRRWQAKHKKGSLGRRKALTQLQQHLGNADTNRYLSAENAGFNTMNQQGKMSRLGAGNVGETFKVNYKKHSNRVFKPESDGKREELDFPASNKQGITAENSRYASRNVGVSAVNKLLGTDVIPDTHLAVKEGTRGQADQIGFAMERAKGLSPRGEELHPLTSPEAIEHAKVFEDMGVSVFNGKYAKRDGKYFEKEYTDQAPELSKQSAYKHWAQNPTTQRGMLDLQANDYITNAGADRHSQNYFVDPKTGRVQGIDNDFALGSKLAQGHNFMARGMPPMMHSATAAHIERLHPDRLKAALGPHVSQAEVAAAVGRLQEMKQHIAALRKMDKKSQPSDRRIVDKFHHGTLKRILKDQKYKSYIQRDAPEALT